ncbi:hypothetical protein P5673_016306 [Acropora cervicornis]|uniref:Uncharacterized protein n=1 Tax=Acropora cervicornis TaxID=6130 RepID=A0AAD9QH76_ACRCE|nr:hypothetical protein P5673_016306 [Acropora cervicornis]
MDVPGSFLKVTLKDLLLSAWPSVLPIWFIALPRTFSLSIRRIPASGEPSRLQENHERHRTPLKDQQLDIPENMSLYQEGLS